MTTRTYTLSLHDALPIYPDEGLDARLERLAVELHHREEIALVGHRHGRHARGGHRRGHAGRGRSEEHTSELQSRFDLVCRLLLEKNKRSNTYSRECGCGT